jgi:two-component system chemotaxis response regulator CheY
MPEAAAIRSQTTAQPDAVRTLLSVTPTDVLEPNAMSAAQQQTILAVDDSASMRQMVRFTLEGAGYKVVQAADGVEALELARNGPVDLVLTDVNMPRMDGIALVRELRSLDSYKFVPMLVLTTESGQETKMRGKQAGATGWIVKPFNPEQLLATIGRVL